MQTSTQTKDHHGSYALLRLGFIALLVLSPLLPYVLNMAYNGYLLVTIPSRIESLPVYPGSKLEKEFIQQDTQTNRCLVVLVHYRTDPPHKNGIEFDKSIKAFYEAVLLGSGWHVSQEPPYRPRVYSKSKMHIQVGAINKKTYRVSITFDVFPFFQPGCLP